MYNFPTEPAAELREWASALRQSFVALTDEGFTDGQALAILKQHIASGIAVDSARDGQR